MVIGRRSMVQGLMLMIGVAAMARRALAGPVTIDKIGDQVQTLPHGQLPEFAAPAPRASGPSISTRWSTGTSSSTFPASAGVPASVTGATGIATSRRSIGTGV